MHKAIEQMLKRYEIPNNTEYEHALKEIIQEIVLLGLWRAKFFEHAAFYGGTALRIFYGLDRFSEDLDFSLIQQNPAFDLKKYHQAITEELIAYGFEVEVGQKQKSVSTNIQSAFVKANTLLYDIEVTINPSKKLKVKFEVDTEPPCGFATETKLLLNPAEFYVKLVAPADLFAGKLHAVLCRGWKNRVKGRDWYDLVWFVKNTITVRIEHLQARMVQSGHLESDTKLDRKSLLDLLNQRIERIDLELVKQDIAPFIKDPSRLDIWSEAFFREVFEKIDVI